MKKEYMVIHSQMVGVEVANSDPCGDGRWSSAAPHVSCTLTPNQATEQKNEASCPMHMLLFCEKTEDGKAAFLPPPFG